MPQLAESQTITALIEGIPTACIILGLDSDPDCDVWVVEVAQPDSDHYISRNDIQTHPRLRLR